MKNQNLQVSQTESEDSEFPPAVNKESSLFDKIKLKIFIDDHVFKTPT